MASLHDNLYVHSSCLLPGSSTSFCFFYSSIGYHQIFFSFLHIAIISHNTLCHWSAALVHYRHMCDGCDLCMLTCLVPICAVTLGCGIYYYFVPVATAFTTGQSDLFLSGQVLQLTLQIWNMYLSQFKLRFYWLQ